MSAFNIGKLQKVEKFGKPALVVNVKDNDGVITENVTIYSVDREGKPFPFFDTIDTGSVIEGVLHKNDKGYVTLYPPKPKFAVGGSGMGAGLVKAKTEAIRQSQERKEKAIATSQDRNEVMYAKKSAAEIIAHHPAYQSLNDANITHIWMNLTRTILNYNPNTSLTALDADTITARNIVPAPEVDEIDASEIPF